MSDDETKWTNTAAPWIGYTFPANAAIKELRAAGYVWEAPEPIVIEAGAAVSAGMWRNEAGEMIASITVGDRTFSGVARPTAAPSPTTPR